MPQSYYIYPVPDSGIPGHPLPVPPGVPGYPLPVPPGPVDPGYDLPGLGWNRPDQGLPPSPGHPWLPGWLLQYLSGPHPSHPWVPPWFNQGPVDPGWGIPVGPGGGNIKHPLLWLLPWLIKPAAPQSVVPMAPAGDKPDLGKVYTKVLVAVSPGVFKWAWLESAESVAEPK